MGVTKECQEAMIEHGVATHGDKPAGHALMNQDTIKISLVGKEFTFDDLAEVVGNEVPYLWGVRELQSDFDPNRDFERITTEALEYWYQGNIEFVEPQERPNIYLFAHKEGIVNGVATMPVNDHPDFQNVGFDVAVVSINMQTLLDGEVRSESALLDTIRHEFGHTFGIAHPETSFYGMRDDGVDVCDNSKDALDQISSYGPDAGVMSMGETVRENFFDTGAKAAIRSGSFSP